MAPCSLLVKETKPRERNHSTASRSASSTGVWGSLSSLTAFSELKYMRLAAILTAVRGTRGSPTRKRAAASETTAASQATGYGISNRGAGNPVSRARIPKISLKERFW
jgi:hypothetical protein